MDWNNGQSYNNPNGQQPYGNWNYAPMQQPNRRANGLAIASLVMALLAVLTICTVYGALIFGSLSILFALLSKGKEKNMHSLAISGTFIGTIALTLTVILFASAVTLLINDSEFKQDFNSLYEEIYGESFDEQLDGILGK